MAMRGDFVDEADKKLRGRNPLTAEGVRPEMHTRWVRTKGYNADGHMQRMRDLGYSPVTRTAETERSGDDPRLTSGQHAQLDGTVKRGDLMLMEIPRDKFLQHRRAQQELTEQRTKRQPLSKFKQMGGYEE